MVKSLIDIVWGLQSNVPKKVSANLKNFLYGNVEIKSFLRLRRSIHHSQLRYTSRDFIGILKVGQERFYSQLKKFRYPKKLGIWIIHELKGVRLIALINIRDMIVKC